jgi:hypothetical protein
MTFNEKSRWIALVANLAGWSWYFMTVGRALAAGVPDTPFLMTMLVPAIIVIVIVHIVGHATIAILKPKEAGAGMDERERAIAGRATRIAYSVLSAGLFVAIGVTLGRWSAFVAVNAVLLAFILAELVRYGVEIHAYRRGFA